MKKVVIWLVALVSAAVLSVVALAATKPNTLVVERVKTVGVSPEVAYTYVADMTHWPAWNPWHDADPDTAYTYTGEASGKGAVMAWQGNDDVGSGSMTVTEAEPGQRIVWAITFLEPMSGTAASTMLFARKADGTQITWTMRSDQTFISKVFDTVLGVEAMIGDSYAKGLEKLDVALQALPAPEKVQAPADRYRGMQRLPSSLSGAGRFKNLKRPGFDLPQLQMALQKHAAAKQQAATQEGQAE